MQAAHARVVLLDAIINKGFIDINTSSSATMLHCTLLLQGDYCESC
jgi:hypothetical protein